MPSVVFMSGRKLGKLMTTGDIQLLGGSVHVQCVVVQKGTSLHTVANGISSAT